MNDEIWTSTCLLKARDVNCSMSVLLCMWNAGVISDGLMFVKLSFTELGALGVGLWMKHPL